MSQIFKKNIPKEYLFNFLSKCCDLNNDKYTFSKSSYKKAKFDKIVEPFCISLKEFYFKSKYNRTLNYISALIFILYLIISSAFCAKAELLNIADNKNVVISIIFIK